MKKTLILGLAASVFVFAACDGDPVGDVGDGGAGGDGAATGGTPATGGGTTGGTGGGTGGSTGGTTGEGGLGGMGGMASLAEVCADWCAAVAAADCASDAPEETCVTDCEEGATAGCEAEWYAWKACEAPLTFECFSFDEMENAVKEDPSACVSEADAELDCYISMNPQ